MKVKIADVVYDSDIEPVMVILTVSDKENIKNMTPEATRYAAFPENFGSADKMRAWMVTPNAKLPSAAGIRAE